MSCSLRLSQTQERKNATKRYCAAHHLHYFKVCPLCDENQKDLEVKNERKKQKKINNKMVRNK